MPTTTQPIRTRGKTPLYKNVGEIKRVLNETAGIWKGRRIDPVKYQRAMRKSYKLGRLKK